MNKQVAILIALLLLTFGSSSYANFDAIVIPNGDLRLKGAGSGLVFPDGSVQYKATEPVTLQVICAAIRSGGMPLPNFCPATVPVADAGTSQVVTPNVQVMLDGSRSSDPNGSQLHYSWEFASKPAGSTAELTNANSSNPTFVPDASGDYVINLVVNNGEKNSSVSTVTVTARYLAIITIIPGNLNLRVGSSQKFTATGTYSDGTIRDVTAAVTWKSSNTAVASVVPTGIATAIQSGTAIITASSGSVSGSTSVYVANDLVTTLVGTAGISGSVDGVGSAARLMSPFGITNDGSSVFISDAGKIRRINLTTNSLNTIAYGSCLRLTSDGVNLYCANQIDKVIEKIVISTGEKSIIAGSLGLAGHTDGVGTNATFDGIEGITTDGQNLYVTDGFVIRKVVISTGEVSTIAGAYDGYNFHVDGIGTSARFNNPRGLATDGINLYITDSGNYAIRTLILSSGVVTTLIDKSNLWKSGARSVGGGIAILNGALYLTDSSNSLVYSVRLADKAVSTVVPIPDQPLGITVLGGALFVSNYRNTVSKISW